MDSRSPAQGLTRQKPRRQPGLQFSSEAQEPLLSSLDPGRIYFLVVVGLRSRFLYLLSLKLSHMQDSSITEPLPSPS